MVYLGNYELDHRENVGSHLAVDIRVPKGTPIQAVANGKVVLVKQKNTGFGNHIVIQHPNVPDYPDSSKKTTLYSAYNHLGSIKVREGEVVEKGEIIALSGDTGTSTTPHLHFQIDRETAPWHPYWPFTSSEANSAGYSFFEAINKGLNKSKAAQHTVNPMEWVQAHLDYSGGGSSADSNQDKNEPKLSEFKIEAEKTDAYTEEQVALEIVAYDQNGDILEEYEPSSDFKISADSGSSRYLRNLKFEKGKTSLNFTDIKEKEVEVTVKDGEISESIELSFTQAPKLDPDQFQILVSRLSVEQGDKVGIIVEAHSNGEKITNYEPSEDFSFKINENEVPIKFTKGVGDLTFIADQIGETSINVRENDLNESLTLTVSEKTEDEENDSENDENEENAENPEEAIVEEEDQEYVLKILGERLSMVGSPITLVVKAYDEDDQLLKDFNPAEAIPVKTDGLGVLQPDSLKASNFVNGVATVNYLTSTEEETVIQIGEESIEVGFISEIKQVSAFAVEHDGKFIPELPEKITIQAIDEEGKATPDYTSIGKVKFSLIDGAGSFEPKELTASDFKNGKAEVIFTASSDGDVKIKAQNGAIVGMSRYLRADSKALFSDVDTKHEFAEAISYLKENDIISGYDDGSFKPEKTVSRVEALKMIIAGLSINLAEDDKIDFPDTESPSWYSPFVATGIEKNIVAGYPDGSFKPSNNIIRAEYLKVLLEAAKVDLNENVINKPYYDVDRDEWYSKYAAYSKENTLFDVDNNKLIPTQKVTRGEVADTIYKIINLEK